MPGYREDLPYIHDAGLRDYALNAAPGLLRMMRKNGVTDGLVVDLGCGSGRWVAELNRVGYLFREVAIQIHKMRARCIPRVNHHPPAEAQ